MNYWILQNIEWLRNQHFVFCPMDYLSFVTCIGKNTKRSTQFLKLEIKTFTFEIGLQKYLSSSGKENYIVFRPHFFPKHHASFQNAEFGRSFENETRTSFCWKYHSLTTASACHRYFASTSGRLNFDIN